ncbi:MAG TPA: uracil-DNA glycosylase family protein [Bacteroidia bacterium]|jgi:hypothetical protein|nr:uracil-DNA glycosylase family protein [Bacteroidia bacterium]
MGTPTFADKVIRFNRQLNFTGILPEGFGIMNPFQEDPKALASSEAFYRKYYDDHRPRRLILGINPGRFGAGVTGIPFTDPKRLIEVCKLPFSGKLEHEPSSVFVYEVVEAYGGPEAFYRDIYINSVCPLGFTTTSAKGKTVNVNYYDDKLLTQAVTPFILESIQAQIDLGVQTDCCFCFGTGKNFQFLNRLNEAHHFFGKVVPMEHPRFIMQYKSKTKDSYIAQYLRLLR